MSKKIVVIANENGAYQDDSGDRVNLLEFPDSATVATKKPVFEAVSLSDFIEKYGYERVEKGTPIPADTPCYEDLTASGFETTEELLSTDLTKVKGIGPATSQKIINHITKGE